MAKILLIEDDSMLYDLYTELLRGEGYDVTTADNGDDALLHLQEGGFDLVLLDLLLPKKNGLEVMQELAKHPPKTPNKRIVIMSNLYHDPMLTQLAKLGITKYIIKSNVNPEELLQTVRHEISSENVA